MKNILLCIAAALSITASFAQEGPRRQHQPREFNPEMMAQRQTESLHRVIGLDSIQYQAVLLMNYADAMTMKDSIDARRARADKLRAEGKKPERVRPTDEQMRAMEETRKQREQVRNEQMKQILTSEQYEKYLKYVGEQKQKMRRGRGKGRGMSTENR